jgi:hypothetical protein
VREPAARDAQESVQVGQEDRVQVLQMRVGQVSERVAQVSGRRVLAAWAVQQAASAYVPV